MINNVANEPNVFVMFPDEIKALAHKSEKMVLFRFGFNQPLMTLSNLKMLGIVLDTDMSQPNPAFERDAAKARRPSTLR